MDTRTRLVNFFEHHNKEKLSDVDKILEQYAGKEPALFAALVKKYGPEPPGTPQSPPGSPPSSSQRTFSTAGSNDDTKARLTRFFEHHNKEKLADVDKIITQYAGKEPALFAALVKKYGPEPPAPEASSPQSPVGSPPSSPQRTFSTAGGMEDPKTRLTRFFEHHNKEKLADVDKILEQYAGKEPALFAALVKKYGPEPPAPQASSPQSRASSPPGSPPSSPQRTLSTAGNTEDPKTRLTRFFEHHNKEKLADVDKIITQYAGKEPALFAALVKKYGPEPPAPQGSSPQSPMGSPPGSPQRTFSSGVEDPKTRLTRFFEHHNKEKLADVDKILEQYAGKETALFAALVKKYGPEPPAPQASAPQSPMASPNAATSQYVDDPRARLTRFFEHHNKEKLADVDKIITQYAGKEPALFAALVKKYGPEPPAPQSQAAASPAAADTPRARLTRFFEHHNKEKLADVDKIITQYAGKEPALFAALVKKYGPEPPFTTTSQDQDQAAPPAGTTRSAAPASAGTYIPLTDPIEYLKYRQINTIDFCKGVGETTTKKALKAHLLPASAAPTSNKASSASPTTSASATPAQAAPLPIRQRLVRFFEKHNKAKIADVDKLMTAYSGKEDALMVALIKKYGPEPTEEEGHMNSTQSNTSHTISVVADTPKARLTRFFEHHNKEKLSDVDKILEQYAGKEPALFAALVKKYGPEPPAPQAASAAVADTPKARLTRFFEHHNKEKLVDVDKIIEQYAGKETALFAALVKKYGPEPPAPQASAPQSPMASPNASPHRSVEDPKTRLTRFFEHHNKEKLADVDKIITQYAGKEPALFAALVKKYGPEPPAPEVSHETPSEQPQASAPTPSAEEEPTPSVKSTVAAIEKASSSSPPSTANLTPAQKVRLQVLSDLEALSGDAFWDALPEVLKKNSIDLPDILPHVLVISVADRNPIAFVQSKFGDYSSRLKRLLVRYDPEKISTADTLLSKMKGDEERSLWTMAQRYGGDEPENTAPIRIINLVSQKKDRSLAYFENASIDTLIAPDTNNNNDENDVTKIQGDMFRAVAEADGLGKSAEEAPPGDCSGDDESTYPGEDEHWVRLRFEMVQQNADIVRNLQKQLKDHISGFQIANDEDEMDTPGRGGNANNGAELPLAHILSKNGVETGDLCVTCSVRVSKAFDALWAPVGHYHRNVMLSTVVKEGYLEKADTSGKSWKRRYCRMKDSGIHYFESEEEGQKPKGYKFFTKTSTVLENLPEIASQDRRFFYFGVTVNNTNEKFYMRVGSEPEKQSWVAFIRDALERIKVNGVGGNSRNDPNPARWRARLASLKTQSQKSSAETSESTKELIRMRKKATEQEPEIEQLERDVDLLRAQATEAADQEVVLQRYLDQQYEELEEARHKCEARKARAIEDCNSIISSRGSMEQQLQTAKEEVAQMTSDIEEMHKRIVELNAEKLREELKCRKVFENYRRSEEALPLATKKAQTRLYPSI